jgi:threonine dehydratase
MIAAIQRLMTEEDVTAEPAGSAAAAALIEDDPPSGTSVLLVTGANIAPDLLQEINRK